jgi:hypothetical protein
LFNDRVIKIDKFRPRKNEQERDLFKKLHQDVYGSDKIAGDTGVIDDVLRSFGSEGKLCLLKAKKEYDGNAGSADLLRLLENEVCLTEMFNRG